MSQIRPNDGFSTVSRLPPGGTLPPDPRAKRRELAMFLLLAVLIWPVLSVAVVGGYGFLVWMSQMILGPPGPPPV